MPEYIRILGKGEIDMKQFTAKLTALASAAVLTASMLPRLPVTAAGTKLTVGKNGTYQTIGAAVSAAAAMKPAGESDRITIAIEPGTYREQLLINTPYLSFVNSDPGGGEVLVTWYYGIGYKYYSAASGGYYNANDAKSKSAKGTAQRWGTAVRLQSGARYFRAENITFENSFNRYVTDEEIADGVEATGETLTVQRTKSLNATAKSSTERAAAMCVEADGCEFYRCNFYSSQDTLYTGNLSYFKECVISGNTDYIFGAGDVVFEACELRFAGYSDNAAGGYITAARQQEKGYLFWNCTVTGNPQLKVTAGYFGRPWRDTAHVLFYHTTLQNENLINPVGWTKMSGVEPTQATFREYDTVLANGAKANTGSRTPGTVLSSCDATRESYLGGWTPYYFADGNGVTAAEIDDEECYRIRNVKSGLYLSADGANIVQSAAGTVWQPESAGGGYYRFRDTESGQYLDVNGEKADNGTNIGLYRESGSGAQLFQLTGSADGYEILTKASVNKSCIGVEAGSSYAGANVLEWERNGSDDQKWILEIYIVPMGGRLMQDIRVFDRENAADWSVADSAENGAAIFGDREVIFQNLPEALNGAEYIRTACDSKNYDGSLAQMTVVVPVTVYVAMDDRVSPVPAWLSDWTKTALEFDNDNNVHFVCYARELDAGESAELGTNGMKGSCVNYLVLAQPRAAVTVTEEITTTTSTETTTTTTGITSSEPVPAVLRGDVNCDEAVDVKDAVALARYVGNEEIALSAAGLSNAELDGTDGLTVDDLTMLLQGIAKLIEL